MSDMTRRGFIGSILAIPVVVAASKLKKSNIIRYPSGALRRKGIRHLYAEAQVKAMNRRADSMLIEALYG